MNTLRWALTGAALFTLAAGATAGELGDKATKLQIAKWVKGDQVDVTKGDKVYVVEFWATWCAPCRTSIPHLTEMQKKYGDKVTFVGVSDEKADVVEKFVKQMGDKMAYTVVADNNKQTSKAYMGEFGINGIPHAFIVDKSGQIIWHDHPMADLEEVIDKVVAGDFDKAAAKKLMKERQEKEKALMEMMEQAQKYFELAQAGGKEDRAAKLGRKLVERGASEPMLMNQLSWGILTAPGIAQRDLELALLAGKAAAEVTEYKDASTIDTYALALYENGKQDEAVKMQHKAIELAKAGDWPEQNLAELESRLERFEKGE